MSKIKICLDAGHYGKYNRSPAVKSYYESDMTWKITQLQKKYLEQLDFEVILTRTNKDKDLALYSRGAASKGCALFISNHSNAVVNGVNESVDYVAVYHLTNDTTTKVDDVSKAVAQKIAPVIASTMGVEKGHKILTRLSSSDKNKDGFLNDNYYGVLNGARQAGTPGLILEHSFHTNTKATKWLLDDANLDKLARAEAQAIDEYFGKSKPEPVVDYTLGMRYLREGCEGEDVRALQILLKGRGYYLGTAGPNKDGVDGDYGPKTKAAVQRFQRDENLEDDGVAGHDTMSHILGIK